MTNRNRITLTVTEAANLLGISRNLCYEAVSKGEIPSLRLGNRLLVPRAALEQLMTAAIGKGGKNDE